VSRRIAVTGASGFIGRRVAAHLTARGDTAVAVRRPFDLAALEGILRATDGIVHLAGVVSAVHERDYVTGNVDATRIVAAAAAAAGVPLIHISSLAAAGPASPRAPRSEADPPAPINAYGRTKLTGERTVAAVDGLRWTILRPGVVYGPGDRALLPVFRLAQRGILPLVGRADAAYTFIHIADLLRVIGAAIDTPAVGDTLFVGHPEPVSTRGLLEGVRAAIGAPARLIRIPLPITRLAAMAGDIGGRLTGRPAVINTRRYAELASEGFVCRVDRLRDCLGVVAEVTLREGLVRAAAWYREQGWL
jgi:nucleoside-diphosphate-sugar epimerase